MAGEPQKEQAKRNHKVKGKARAKEANDPDEFRLALWPTDTLDKELAGEGDQNQSPETQSQPVSPEVRQSGVAETSKSGAPSVKLSMNLNIEMELKAKIKGRVELSILGGKK
ncbi:unnamed protein product [Clonostachys byssicola]|uniref:Uncharacterized protein n=1 Tax=Clonostachys byssicola TaxID=160290 RepID=A0A9N9Y8Z6_9HYPO|nr:unnamed protein product [Clonostachys byssicola]